MQIMDGDWRLLNYNPHSGKSTWVMWDERGREVIREIQPVDTAIETNAAIRGDVAGKRFGDYHHVASIPLQLYHSSGLARAHDEGDDKYVSRFFNDSDNRAWRTSEAKL